MPLNLETIYLVARLILQKQFLQKILSIQRNKCVTDIFLTSLLILKINNEYLSMFY
jgi:hypothetical protein